MSKPWLVLLGLLVLVFSEGMADHSSDGDGSGHGSTPEDEICVHECTGNGACEYGSTTFSKDLRTLARCHCYTEWYGYDCSSDEPVSYVALSMGLLGDPQTLSHTAQTDIVSGIASFSAVEAVMVVITDVANGTYASVVNQTFWLDTAIYSGDAEGTLDLFLSNNGSDFREALTPTLASHSFAFAPGANVIVRIEDGAPDAEADWWSDDVDLFGVLTVEFWMVIAGGLVLLILLVLTIRRWRAYKNGKAFNRLSMDDGQSKAEQELYRHYRFDY